VCDRLSTLESFTAALRSWVLSKRPDMCTLALELDVIWRNQSQIARAYVMGCQDECGANDLGSGVSGTQTIARIELARSPRYRADIDGLRAVAVLAVVFFHAFPSALGGGFIGVDIFFVISGFLISSIIIEDLAVGKFSFASFYVRRIRRIFPSLLVVLTATFIAGKVLLSVPEFAQLAFQSVAGLAFVSNILLWAQIGYFDAAAETKPLLHLWSLGVEEQYYAVWPLFLWFMFTKHIPLVRAMIGVALISFVANLAMSRGNYLDAFYLPQARMWQLVCGALLTTPIAFVNSGRNASYVGLIGVALIAIGLLTISSGEPYPGWRALLPTVGAAAIIAAGPESWINKRLLENRLLVAIGLISYPLYLWHWPILVFARTILGHTPSVEHRLLLIALAVLLAFVTYRFIEMPIRFGRRGRRVWSFALPGVAVALALVALGAGKYAESKSAAFETANLTEAQHQQIAALARASAIKDTFQTLYGDRPCFKFRVDQTIEMFLANGCLDRQSAARESVLLIGDSHSASLSLGLRPFIENKGFNFLQVSTGFCEPTSNDPNDSVCIAINEEVRRRVSTLRPKLVVIDASWVFASQPPYFLGNKGYYQHLLAFISSIIAGGANKVLVIGQIPAWVEALPDYLSKNYVSKGLPIPDRTYDGVHPEALKIDDVMRSLRYPVGAAYLSMRDVLCDDSGCLTRVGPDLEKDVTLWDYGHLTVSGADYVVKKMIAPVWSDIMDQSVSRDDK
jgi:peptidoglycan/LPS O-acetylase OafA/YrhL